MIRTSVNRLAMLTAAVVAAALLSVFVQPVSAAPMLAQGADYATGTDAFSVTSADFDGDGNRDLATANSGSNTVSVLLGDGSGSFADKTDFPTGASPASVTSADFDGDGNRDLAVANLGSNTVSVLLGDGSGSFAAKTDFPTGSDPYSVSSDDFNADGRPDLAVANYGSNTVSILLGDGSGGFGARTNFPTGGGPRSVTIDDLNNDGNPDLAVANYGSHTVSVLLGDGSGGFAARTDFPTGPLPRSVTSADFDGDGNGDLAVANASSGSVSVLLGDGSGSLGPKTDYSTTEFFGVRYPTSVTSEDFNNDGNPDLATSNQDAGPSTVSILLGDGSGGFRAKTDFPTGSSGLSVIGEDFSNDGRPDLVVANGLSNTVSVLLGDGSGGFGARNDVPDDSSGYSVIGEDFDGDGNRDLGVATQTFASDGNVSIMLGDGAGGFGAMSEFAAGKDPSWLVSGLFDADTVPDLAVANRGDSTVSILLGDGSGGFAAKTDFGTGSNPVSVTSADFNGDGNADLAVANLFGGSVSILLGDGIGGFGPKNDLAVGQFPGSVASADFNEDGNPDLAVSNEGDDDVSVLFLDSNGDLVSRTDFPTGDGPVSVISSDFDNDNNADIATANRESDDVSVLLGDGSGSFATKADFAVGSLPLSITSDDFDGDGNPDLATADLLSDNVAVLLGDGSGSFAAKTEFSGVISSQSITSDDFDGDGRPDLATSSTGAINNVSPVSVFFGIGAPTAPMARASDPRIAFGRHGAAQATRVVAVRNGGGAPLNVGAVSLTGVASSEYEIVSNACSGETFDVGQTCLFSVRFGGSADGFKRAKAMVASDAPNSPLAIPLTGFRDATSPVITIDSGPAGPTNDTTPSFEFSADEDAEFECRLFEQSTTAPAFAACSGPGDSHTPDPALADGVYTFQVRATDQLANVGLQARDFTVDTVPPGTTIDSGPTGTITTDQATFTFRGDPNVDIAKFQCRIDGEPFADCTSPKTFTGLTDGPHTVAFRAEDVAGNQDPSPATRTFTVDTTPPVTTIDSGPTGTITTNEATFTFSSNEAGSSFECGFDGSGLSPCSSPKTYPGLSDGPHRFAVRAIDEAGNTDLSQLAREFTVDTTVYKAKIARVTVGGPARVKRNRKATYRVSIKNSGNAAANGVRLRVSGRGIRVNSPVGRIGAGKSRTIRLKVRPRRAGKIRAQFRVSSNNAGKKTVNRTITVRK